MGVPIPETTERKIRRLLAKGESQGKFELPRQSKRRIESRIARTFGVNRKTVRSIREGKSLRSIWAGCPAKRSRRRAKRVNREVAPKLVGQYVCLECSASAGHEVRVVYEPCVACLARLERERQRLSVLANTPPK